MASPAVMRDNTISNRKSRQVEQTFMQSPVAVATLKKLEGGRRFRRSEEGQDLLEYGLLAALIAIIALGAVSTVGNVINRVFWTSIARSF